MYSTKNDVENVLAQTFTSASPSSLASGSTTPNKMSQIGNKAAVANFSPDIVYYHIRMADAEIDAALRQQYKTPIAELCSLQMNLMTSIDEYSTVIYVDRALNLTEGDVVIITDGSTTDRLEVDSVNGPESFTPTTMPSNTYLSTEDDSSTRVLKVNFPSPIPFISARLAAASICDKYFSAQTSPGKTEYGDKLRSLALEELNNIREGRTELTGVPRKGWRFANPNLVDRYSLKSQLDQDGTRSSNGGR
jgi:hypothetical protein